MSLSPSDSSKSHLRLVDAVQQVDPPAPVATFTAAELARLRMRLKEAGALLNDAWSIVETAQHRAQGGG
jgi:hypothetical protein